jgi:hypothetical protein
MLRILKSVVLAWLSVLASGCSTTQNPSQAARLNVWMTRWADVADHRPIQRNTFSKDDRPTAVLQNLGLKEQTVYVEFIHADSNRSVFNQGTAVVPRQLRCLGAPRPLPAGTYHLKVTPQNSPPLMQTFAVYGD